jgi:CRISPR-associated protein Csb2
MLVLEIEHLLGVAFAAQTPDSAVADWPPQPDRVFSALVAAWAARGEVTEERRALEWLEGQPAPEIAASDGFQRTPATVFVPPNDPGTGRVGNLSVMPALRRRQPRRFPAFRPDDPVVQLVWPLTDADQATVSALNALAADTPYIGHSSSLTRCHFRTDGVPENRARARRRVYGGRLRELERAYHAGRRPSPGEDVHTAAIKQADVARSVFADRWLVLEDVAGKGEMPDLRAAAMVAKELRYAFMSGYRQAGLGNAIPSLVSGHSASGSPTTSPHLAIAPLAYLGSEFADGRVFGFALIPPGDGELLDDETFRDALRAVASWSEDEGRRELQLKAQGFDIVLTPTPRRGLQSLDPTLYVTVARTWATCTPIVLDRHLKAKGNADREAEVASMVRDACSNIGLPKPSRIEAGKHSAIGGAPSAYPSGGSPRWTGWRLPDSFASRQLTHAMLQFDEPVRGPVILGAGRFAGLGLCRALDPERT